MAVRHPKRRAYTADDTTSNLDPGKRPTSGKPYDPKRDDIVSQPNVSYVASTSLYPFIRTDIILAGTIDEAARLNGWQIWDDMVLDPTGAGLNLWCKTNVLGDGMNIESRTIEPPYGSENVSPQDLQNADWARRYCKEIVTRLEYVDRDIMDRLWEMMDGIRYPEKLAEITWDTLPYGNFAGLPGISAIRPKPKKNYNLVMDEMNRLRGVLGVVPGGSIAKWSGIINDASKLPNVLSMDKFLLLYGDSRDGVPRSLWNGVYQPWARLQTEYIELMRACRTMAGGKVSVVLGELQKSLTYDDPKTGQRVDLLQRTSESVQNWGNSGSLTLPPGCVPTVHFPNGKTLSDFIEAIQLSKHEMAMALILNSKAILEGNIGSGLSENKADDDTDPVVSLIKLRVCKMLSKMFYTAVKLARGEEFAYRYSPVASMEKGQNPDFALNGTTYSQLVAAEAVFPSQLDDYADKIGVRRPSAQEKKDYADVHAAKQEQTINPPEPAMPGATAKPKETKK